MIHRACIPTHRTAESTTFAGDGSATRHGQRTPVDGKPACVIPARTRSGNRHRACIPISKIGDSKADDRDGSSILHAKCTPVDGKQGSVISSHTEPNTPRITLTHRRGTVGGKMDE